jgi:hypothetical protein
MYNIALVIGEFNDINGQSDRKDMRINVGGAISKKLDVN